MYGWWRCSSRWFDDTRVAYAASTIKAVTFVPSHCRVVRSRYVVSCDANIVMPTSCHATAIFCDGSYNVTRMSCRFTILCRTIANIVISQMFVLCDSHVVLSLWVVAVDFDDAFGHLSKLVDETLAIDLIENAARVVIPRNRKGNKKLL